MRFMMFVCVGERAHEPADPSAVPDVEAWVERNDRAGIRIDGEVLVGPSEAKTVRVRDGEVLLTDGPFAETKEYIAGFDILECASLEEAIQVAASHPMAHTHMIEVRPFHVWEE